MGFGLIRLRTRALVTIQNTISPMAPRQMRPMFLPIGRHRSLSLALIWRDNSQVPEPRRPGLLIRMPLPRIRYKRHGMILEPRREIFGTSLACFLLLRVRHPELKSRDMAVPEPQILQL